jgi:hypothetical protein
MTRNLGFNDLPGQWDEHAVQEDDKNCRDVPEDLAGNCLVRVLSGEFTRRAGWGSVGAVNSGKQDHAAPSAVSVGQ